MTRGGSESRPSLADAYPTIARWALGYGWVEFGIDGLDRPFVRALDEGGIVWEREVYTGTPDEALADLEEGLALFMEEQGFVEEPQAKEAAPHHGVTARRAKQNRKEATKPPVDPALKKVEKLEEIAEAPRRGEDFSITRLTVIKGLCEGRWAAGEFALFLARRVQRNLRAGEAPERYRKLVDRAIREMRYYLADPADVWRDGLLREMQSERDEHRNMAWGSVRIMESRDPLKRR